MSWGWSAFSYVTLWWTVGFSTLERKWLPDWVGRAHSWAELVLFQLSDMKQKTDYLLLWRRQIFSACWQWLYVTYSVFIITNSCLSSSWLLVRELKEDQLSSIKDLEWWEPSACLTGLGLRKCFEYKRVSWWLNLVEKFVPKQKLLNSVCSGISLL